MNEFLQNRELNSIVGGLLFRPAGSVIPAVFAVIFGLLVGSFLNLVIYRLPKMMQRESDNYMAQESGQELPHTDRYNLTLPRSACPQYDHQIGALENIPVISYLILGGKCKSCKTLISSRYPIIELLTGALSGFLIWRFGSGGLGVATLLFAYLMLAMTFIDAG